MFRHQPFIHRSGTSRQSSAKWNYRYCHLRQIAKRIPCIPFGFLDKVQHTWLWRIAGTLSSLKREWNKYLNLWLHFRYLGRKRWWLLGQLRAHSTEFISETEGIPSGQAIFRQFICLEISTVCYFLTPGIRPSDVSNQYETFVSKMPTPVSSQHLISKLWIFYI